MVEVKVCFVPTMGTRGSGTLTFHWGLLGPGGLCCAQTPPRGCAHLPSRAPGAGAERQRVFVATQPEKIQLNTDREPGDGGRGRGTDGPAAGNWLPKGRPGMRAAS